VRGGAARRAPFRKFELGHCSGVALVPAGLARQRGPAIAQPKHGGRTVLPLNAQHRLVPAVKHKVHGACVHETLCIPRQGSIGASAPRRPRHLPPTHPSTCHALCLELLKQAFDQTLPVSCPLRTSPFLGHLRRTPVAGLAALALRTKRTVCNNSSTARTAGSTQRVCIGGTRCCVRRGVRAGRRACTRDARDAARASPLRALAAGAGAGRGCPGGWPTTHGPSWAWSTRAMCRR